MEHTETPNKVPFSALHDRAARSRALALVVGLALILAGATASAARAEAPHNTVAFSCTAITYTFYGFPNANNNTVTEQITVDGARIYEGTFVFNGPTASNTVAISLSPGHHSIDGRTHWNTNGVRGGKDTKGQHGLTCPTLAIHVPSDRSNLISGNETLVAVDLPAGTSPGSVKVSLNGGDVTSQFAMRANGRYEGLVTGLKAGPNLVKATAPGPPKGGVSAQYTIFDHVIGGPITAGPQVLPWRCKNAHPTDAQCDEATTYTYEYKNAVTGQLETYEPGKPPEAALIASTTTENGQTVPFIVRTETGYQDRDQYKIAVLYQPGLPWEAWAPQPQFIHKLLITHGASCGIEHQTGSAPSVTSDEVGVPGGTATGSPTAALGLGFAVMSTALDNAGHNCNIATQAESLIMAKEHLIDHYGTLRFTIGTGCSGGSLVQQQVANAYPGIYQGILPQCSFQDAWSGSSQIADYHLTLRYFENPVEWGTGIAWTPAQIGEVEGHPNPGNAVIFNAVYWEELANPVKTCAGVEASEAYNPGTNPGGVRCALADYMINVFGPRLESSWGAVEKALGHGFGGRGVGNVGEQYGLKALKEGTISPAQFADINTKAGGVGIDNEHTTARITADQPALQYAYRSGAVNETNNLKSVAMIDLRGPDPGAFHDAFRSWSVRARLEREEGHFPKNHVIWFGPAPLIGSPTYTTEGLKEMNRWLNAVEADTSKKTLEEKIATDRPESVHDQCTPQEASEELVKEVEIPGVGKVCEAPDVETRFATPRVVAGEAITTDNMECQLKPLVQSDYSPIVFTAEEWKALEAAFPTGVCDFSKPGVGQQKTIPWQTYQNDNEAGAVLYGGKPLGEAPANSGEGWTSATFAGWLK
jgi:uncharacterized tannase-like protein DUF6351